MQIVLPTARLGPRQEIFEVKTPPLPQLTILLDSLILLFRALGSVRLSRSFPVSPGVSESAKSDVPTSKQPYQYPEASDGVNVKSECGSIGQAQSLADESGAATSIHVQDAKSAKSAKSSNSIRSSLADIFRSKHRSPSSKQFTLIPANRFWLRWMQPQFPPIFCPHLM